MRRRRMHRQYLPEPPDREVLEKLVYAAGRAQVARPGIRHLIVVDDYRIVRTLRQACPGFVNDAPVAIAICSDLVRSEEESGSRGVEVVSRLDAGACAAFIALAAPALGIGVCKVTSWSEEVVQAILGLPEHIRPEVLMAVGAPVSNPTKALTGFQPSVHINRFGEPWNPNG
ncbi:MAG: hypothetical protein F4Y75_02050 [Acidimicrobiia bacterium]|nr:hypothetical protein [Acidimicrobiia bacterium]